jgi:hypothetical protein
LFIFIFKMELTKCFQGSEEDVNTLLIHLIFIDLSNNILSNGPVPVPLRMNCECIATKICDSRLTPAMFVIYNVCSNNTVAIDQLISASIIYSFQGVVNCSKLQNFR